MGEILEVVSVGLAGHLFESKPTKMLLIPVTGKAGGEMIRREVGEAAKRDREDDCAARLEEAGEFLERADRVRHMLQHLGAENCIKARVRFGDFRDIADKIRFPIGPRRHMSSHAIAMTIIRLVVL